MTTAKIVGIFKSRHTAQATIHTLFEHQYPREHISLLTPNMPAQAPTVPHITAPTEHSQLHSTVAVVVETPEKIVPRTIELLQQHGAVEIKTFKPQQQGTEQVDADAATRPEQAWEQSSKAGTVAGTAAGAAAGAAIGALGGPPGAAVGGLLGAAIGAGTGAASDAIGKQAEAAPQPTTEAEEAAAAQATLRTAVSKAFGMAQMAGATLTGTPINPATSATIDQHTGRAMTDTEEPEES